MCMDNKCEQYSDYHMKIGLKLKYLNLQNDCLFTLKYSSSYSLTVRNKDESVTLAFTGNTIL